MASQMASANNSLHQNAATPMKNKKQAATKASLHTYQTKTPIKQLSNYKQQSAQNTMSILQRGASILSQKGSGSQGRVSKNEPMPHLTTSDKIRLAQFKNEKDFFRFLDIMVKPSLSQTQEVRFNSNSSNVSVSSKNEQLLFVSQSCKKIGTGAPSNQNLVPRTLKLYQHELRCYFNENLVFEVSIRNIHNIECEHMNVTTGYQSAYKSVAANKDRKYFFKMVFTQNKRHNNHKTIPKVFSMKQLNNQELQAFQTQHSARGKGEKMAATDLELIQPIVTLAEQPSDFC